MFIIDSLGWTNIDPKLPKCCHVSKDRVVFIPGDKTRIFHERGLKYSRIKNIEDIQRISGQIPSPERILFVFDTWPREVCSVTPMRFGFLRVVVGSQSVGLPHE